MLNNGQAQEVQHLNNIITEWRREEITKKISKNEGEEFLVCKDL